MSEDHHHIHIEGEKNLKTAFFLNFFFTLIEFVGGIYVNSVAIVSDAVHDLGDSISLGTAWYLERKSKKQANDTFNFGYRRFSILGALINGIILLIGSGFVIVEAIKRLQHPESSNAEGMIVLALLGIVVNGWAVLKLRQGTSLNERVISLHLWEDVLGWVAVLLVAIVLLFWNIPILDPLLSLSITAYILYGTLHRLYETLYILMQGSPHSIDHHSLKNEILQMVEIKTIKEYRMWTLDGEHHVLTLQLELKTKEAIQEKIVLEKLEKWKSQYSITYLTVAFH